jgi:hypothetical protein
MLKQRGFSPKCMYLIQSLLNKGLVDVRINDVNSDYFETSRVRQVTKECQMGPRYSPTWFLVQEGHPPKG